MRLVLPFLVSLVSDPSRRVAPARADHRKWRFAEGFSVTNRPPRGMSQPQIADMVEEMFRCPPAGLRRSRASLFLEPVQHLRSSGVSSKAAGRRPCLLCAQEILKRAPSQVFYKNPAAKVSAYKQLRSDLGVVAAEVGVTPSIQALPMPWTGSVHRRKHQAGADERRCHPHQSPDGAAAAVGSHLAVRDPRSRTAKTNGAVMAKTALILQWMKLVTSGNSTREYQDWTEACACHRDTAQSGSFHAG